jgi:hypothetical protein
MVHIGMYGLSQREIQVKIKIPEENILQGFLLTPVDR